MLKIILKLIASIIIATSFLLFPVAAHAVDVIDPSLCTGTTNPDFICKDKIADKSTTNPLFGPSGALTTVINILSLVVGVIAAIVIVIAGIRYALSGGDSQKVTNSRSTIIYAIVAIVIAAIAQAIVAFVLKKI